MAYENFFATRLTNPINAVDDVIELDRAPEVTEGWLVLEARSFLNREIIRFTGVSGNFITGVARGQQDTVAKSHEGFAAVEMNVTKADLDEALNINSNIPQTIKDVFGDETQETTFAAQQGLNWTQSTGRLGSMTAGVVYIAGYRTVVDAVVDHNFPASKDVYVDVNPTGDLVYVPVNNGDPEPAKAVDTVRIALIKTDATDITELKDIREKPYDNWDLSTGSVSIITKETPIGLVDGSNRTYLTIRPYVGGSLQGYINGLAQSGYIEESNPGIGEFKFDVAPLVGDDVKVAYQYATVATINADTVDSYHASATPTANMIPVLDSTGRLPFAALPVPRIVKAYLTANATQTTGTSYTSYKVNLNAIDNTLSPDFTLSSNGIVIPAGVSYVRVSLVLVVGSMGSLTSEAYASINVNGANKLTTYFPGLVTGTTSPRHWSVQDFFAVNPGDVIYAYASSSVGSMSIRFDTGTRLIVEVLK